MKCDCFIIIFYGEKTMDLFEYAKSKTLDQESPLASRLRPTTLDEVVGQQHIIGKNTLLYRAIKADKLTSVIFYGPPGTGKTTLAKVIANTTSAEFTQINATVAGKKDMEAVVKEAQQNLGMYGKKTILFIDEIHRFNKGQQDYLLPFVEDGTIILIGATTENPYFEVNAALISRSIIFELKSLEISEVKELILRAVNDKTKGMGNYKARIDEDALDFLADMAGGDARNALNAIELGILTTPRSEDGLIHITLDVASQCIQKRVVRYDKNGDNHYDIISAFIKSMRGSDPDAAVYYLAKMLYAGEDVKFIARRIMILASEDIGNADPQALCVAVAAAQAVERVGMPESQIILSQAVTYMACAPKSNSAVNAIFAAMDSVKRTKTHSPATPPGRPLRRPRKTGPRHRLQIRPRLPKPLRTPTIPPHRNPGRTLLRTLRNGLRENLKRIPEQNQIPVLIQKRAASKERLPFSSFNSHNVHLRQNRIHTLLKSKLSCIQTQIIIRRITPVPTGKFTIIILLSLIIPTKKLLNLLITAADLLSGLLHTKLPGCMNKHSQSIRSVLKHIIHTTPNDHTGFLLCQIRCNLRLIIKNILIRNKPLLIRCDQISFI